MHTAKAKEKLFPWILTSTFCRLRMASCWPCWTFLALRRRRFRSGCGFAGSVGGSPGGRGPRDDSGSCSKSVAWVSVSADEMRGGVEAWRWPDVGIACSVSMCSVAGCSRVGAFDARKVGGGCTCGGGDRSGTVGEGQGYRPGPPPWEGSFSERKRLASFLWWDIQMCFVLRTVRESGRQKRRAMKTRLYRLLKYVMILVLHPVATARVQQTHRTARNHASLFRQIGTLYWKYYFRKNVVHVHVYFIAGRRNQGGWRNLYYSLYSTVLYSTYCTVALVLRTKLSVSKLWWAHHWWARTCTTVLYKTSKFD